MVHIQESKNISGVQIGTRKQKIGIKKTIKNCFKRIVLRRRKEQLEKEESKEKAKKIEKNIRIEHIEKLLESNNNILIRIESLERNISALSDNIGFLRLQAVEHMSSLFRAITPNIDSKKIRQEIEEHEKKELNGIFPKYNDLEFENVVPETAITTEKNRIHLDGGGYNEDEFVALPEISEESQTKHKTSERKGRKAKIKAE